MHFDFSHSFVSVNHTCTSFIDIFFRNQVHYVSALDVSLCQRFKCLYGNALISVSTNTGVEIVNYYQFYLTVLLSQCSFSAVCLTEDYFFRMSEQRSIFVVNIQLLGLPKYLPACQSTYKIRCELVAENVIIDSTIMLAFVLPRYTRPTQLQ